MPIVSTIPITHDREENERHPVDRAEEVVDLGFAEIGPGRRWRREAELTSAHRGEPPQSARTGATSPAVKRLARYLYRDPQRQGKCTQ